MLVNIWATVTHLSDGGFAGAGEVRAAGLDLLLCEHVSGLTGERQIWMVNAVYRSPGTTAVLLRESYATLRDAPESSLVLVTPGFADVALGVPSDLVQRQLRQICRRARAFNKRPIGAALGVPPGCPRDVAERIGQQNDVFATVIESFQGVLADLRELEYTPWTETGSRPADVKAAAACLGDAVLCSHASPEQWRQLRERV